MVSRRTFAGSNITNVKAHNLQAILRILLRREAVSRVHLAHLTGLSNTTITNLVTELLDQGIIIEGGLQNQERVRAGRPRTNLHLEPSAGYAVGVHIGIGNIRVAVVNLFGEVKKCLVLSHQIDDPAADVLSQVVDLIEQVITETDIDRSRIVGVGVGASGLVDSQTGINVLAPNLGWYQVAIRDVLSQQLKLSVFVDNNVRAMALAESMFGAARDVNTQAFVYARVGVGAGFVIRDNIYRGGWVGAGEIGHTTIIPVGGILCRCGNTGCLETLFSEPEIVRQAQHLVTEAPDSLLASTLASIPIETKTPTSILEGVFEAARRGDRNTQAMLEERSYYMGLALAHIVNTINPDMIIMGGLFVAGHDVLLPQIKKTMRERSFASLGDNITLQVTSFGRMVGVIGAAALALDLFFYRQGIPPVDLLID